MTQTGLVLGKRKIRTLGTGRVCDKRRLILHDHFRDEHRRLVARDFPEVRCTPFTRQMQYSVYYSVTCANSHKFHFNLLIESILHVELSADEWKSQVCGGYGFLAARWPGQSRPSQDATQANDGRITPE